MSALEKVVIVGPLPPPAGGMANQTRKLAEFLISEHLDVAIVQMNKPYKPSWIGNIPLVRALFRLVPYFFDLYKQIKTADVVHIMANSGWSWHLFTTPAVIIARLLSKPIIINYRGGYARDFFEQSWWLVKRTLNKAHAIVVPSTFLEEVFADFNKSADIVPNVLDQEVFSPKTQASDITAPHLIVTRNLEAIYDVATAIKAFALIKAQFPQAKLSVAGTGPELANLQQLAAALNVTDSVNFTGRLDPDGIAKLYKSADVMLNTSTVDNTPNSIIESLACGTPVVSSNVGGIPKLVTHQHDALLINVGDAQSMATLVVEILENKSLRDSLIKNGLATISRFYWPNVWMKLKNCYDRAILLNHGERAK
ncbi:glycosyltransferase family 4 protein [Colwelliaceae bacterium 6471]